MRIIGTVAAVRWRRVCVGRLKLTSARTNSSTGIFTYLLTNFSRIKDELAYSTFVGVHVGKHLMKSIVVSV